MQRISVHWNICSLRSRRLSNLGRARWKNKETRERVLLAPPAFPNTARPILLKRLLRKLKYMWKAFGTKLPDNYWNISENAIWEVWVGYRAFYNVYRINIREYFLMPHKYSCKMAQHLWQCFFLKPSKRERVQENRPNSLCKLWTWQVMFYFSISRVKLTWGHAHKTWSWYLLGVAFTKSDEHPRHFYMGVPLPQANILKYIKSSRIKDGRQTTLAEQICINKVY